jgi:hypothetical protein
MNFRTVALAGALFLSLTGQAGSHGPAQWIQDGGYKNNVGEFCCGERDCAELAAGDVVPTLGGFLIKSLNETVPFSAATPSPDGKFWRCYWNGQRKCFFYPPGAV